MCGISAVTGSEDIVAILYESILNLEYRGYDSCGLGVVGNGNVTVRKNTGGVEEVNRKEHLTKLKGKTGIAHTRWATHGKVSRENAHPHNSADGQFSIVHNGIINNYEDLRDELMAQGVVFKSETDTEVMAHLLEKTFQETGDIEQAFIQSVKRLEGSFAFCMVSARSQQTIYCVRQGSPLVLGLGTKSNFVASDVNAFLQHTRKALVLEDGEYATVTPDSVTVRKTADGSLVSRKPIRIEWDAETSRKGGYAHYMLKEIFEQPQTIRNALAATQEGVERIASQIRERRDTYMMGVGTTHYVAQAGQYFFSSLAGKYLPVVSSDEFVDLAVVGPQDMVMAISQSGETYDTRRGIAHAKDQGARTASIVNVMGSSLSMSTDEVIMQGSGPEICVVSTKAALAQMVILLRLALETGLQEGTLAAEQYDESYSHLKALPDTVTAVLNERSGFVRNLADKTVGYRNWLMLGRGIYYPMALEAALKLKEITYLHVEGMAAGFLKHGTLALVDEEMMSFFLVPTPEEKELNQHTISAIEEVKARKGPVIGIAFENDKRALKLLDHAIELPPTPPLVAPLLELVVAQLFSYFSALKLGRSIDKPRNLAKSVTVG
ncbi:MAG: glutamine--fructose-6-phosphate transaminase (isomerizing) [Deltaproteobacteria bacterium]|nr:glutamine--fructose-6-phosphate transaminase (isomerizing) [Deltaproteobacteria bacterium]